MSKLIFVALLVAIAYSQTCGPRETAQNEGCCGNCYHDSVGIPTIGIGFNMKRSDAASVLHRYGVNITKALASCGSCRACSSTKNEVTLSADDAFNMFQSILYPPFIGCVDGWTPGLPPTVKAAVVDMAYNLGCAGVKGFPSMKRQLDARNWTKAAEEAANSRWCRQVGSRCSRDTACIRTGR